MTHLKYGAGHWLAPSLERDLRLPGPSCDLGMTRRPDNWARRVQYRPHQADRAARRTKPAARNLGLRQFAVEGGLMAYGPDTADIFRRSAAYVDRILKRGNPADRRAEAIPGNG
jgi:hypothetical protein